MKKVLSIVFVLLSLNLMGQSYQLVIDGRLPPGNQNGEINYGDGTFTARGGSVNFSINNFNQENVQFRQILDNQTFSILNLGIEYFPVLCPNETFGKGLTYTISELIAGPNQNRMGISQCEAYISVDAIPENMNITANTTKACAGETIDLLNSDSYPLEARTWRYRIPAYQGNPGLSGYITDNFLSNDKKLASFTLQDLLGEETRNYIGSTVEFYMGYGAFRFSDSIQVEIDDCTPLAQTLPLNANCFNGAGSVDIQFDRGLRVSENEYILIELNNVYDGFSIPLANNEINSLDNTNGYSIPETLISGSYEIQFQSWIDPDGFGGDDPYPNGLGFPVLFEILAPTPVIIDNVVTVQNPSCPGEFGERTIKVSGGQEFQTGIYQYTKDAGASWQTSTSPNSITYTDLEPSENYTFGVKLVFSDGSGECISDSSVYQSVPDISNPLMLAPGTGIANQPSSPTSEDGIIFAEVTGGSQNFNFELYSASDPVNPISIITQSARIHQFTNLGIGFYFLKIKDNNGCEVDNESTPYELVATPSPTIDSQQITEIGCLGDNNGSIIIDISDGVAPYNYQWTINGVISPIQTTGNQTISLNNLSEPGEYILKVASTGFTDFDAPSGYVSTTITMSPPEEVIIASATPNNISCIGAADGNITITATGGSSYEYKLGFFGTWTPLNNETIPITIGGFYDVYLRNENNCEADPLIGVLVSEPDKLTVASTSDNATTSGGNQGAITLNIAGGTPFSTPAEPYAIIWTKDGLPFSPKTGSTSTNLVNLEAGEYIAQITDANGCSPLINPPITIDQPGALGITSLTATSVYCKGEATGGITAAVTGVAPFNYIWERQDGQPITSPNTPTIANLAKGIYILRLTDASGDLEVTETVTITEPLETLYATVVPTAASCYSGNDGSIQITALGGTAPYEYAIDDGIGFQVSNTFNDLAPRTYEVTVRDNNSCEFKTSVEIIEPLQISVTESISNVTSTGGSNGSITLEVSGGTEPYTYSWTGPGITTPRTTKDIDVLVTGNYTVEITSPGNQGGIDGCYFAQTFFVSEPGPLSINNITTTDVNCYDETTGSITTMVNGEGTVVYEWTFADGGPILISNGTNGPDITGIAAGSYMLTVTDDNTTTSSSPIAINQPTAPLNITNIFTTDVSCFGGTDGSVQIEAFGGTGTYTYSLDGINYQNSAFFNGLAQGSITAYIRDSNNCDFIYPNPVIINEPQELSFVIDILQSISAANDSDGAISISASGGTGNLSYSWTGPNGFTSTDEDIIDLAAGDYILTITDDNYALNNNLGCILVSSPITISEPGALLVDLTQTIMLECNGDDFGEITATVQGGVPPYTYEWFQVTNSNSTIEEDTEIIGNLPVGQYFVRVTDANAISTESLPISITQPEILEITVDEVTNVLCNGSADGTITVSVSGGTGPYNYFWSNGSTDQNLSGLESGEYTLEVFDDNGCFEVTSVIISPAPNPVRIVDATVINVSQYMANDGNILLQIEGGAAPYAINWIRLSDNMEMGSSPKISNLQAGSYEVFISDANGCLITETYDISEPDIVEESIKHPSCAGQNDGSIEVIVNQGNGNFTYNWDTGETTNNISNLAPGVYTITINGVADVPIRRTYLIEEPIPLEVDLGGDRTLCSGQKLVLNATTDNANTTYNWTSDTGFFSSEPRVTINESGNYSVVITNQNGCMATSTIFVDVTDDLINAEFAVSSQVFVGESLIAVDISYPLPETQKWILPDGASVIKQDSDEAEMVFSEPGEYEIGILTQIGECFAQQTKKVLVMENEVFSSGDDKEDPKKLIEDFIIYPNPTNGKFTADIVLTERGNISIKIFNFANNALMSSKKDRGESSYTIPFDLSGLPSGVYAVLLETPYGNSLRKVILK